MQTVCDQKIFGVFPEKAEKLHQAVSRIKSMNPAEVRLEWQVFLGGLVVSGLMLLASRALGF